MASRSKKRLPSPGLYDFEFESPADFRWYRQMAANSDGRFGAPVYGNPDNPHQVTAWRFPDAPERDSRVVEAIQAAHGKFTRRSSTSPKRSNIRPASPGFTVLYGYNGRVHTQSIKRASLEAADQCARELRAKGERNVRIVNTPQRKDDWARFSPALKKLRKTFGVRRSNSELQEMKMLLVRHGFKDAARRAAIYQAQGMGPFELEHRLKTKFHGRPMLDDTKDVMRFHGLGKYAKQQRSPLNRAKVIKANGREQAVKNLGWLLRNWKSVERFVIREPPGGPWSKESPHTDAVMIAYCRDGVRYETNWGSKEILKDWIHRPVFRGIDVDWFGEHRKA